MCRRACRAGPGTGPPCPCPCASTTRRGCRDGRRRRCPPTVEWRTCITTRRALRPPCRPPGARRPPPALPARGAPPPRRELAVPQVLEAPVLPAVELADEEVFLAFPVEVHQ